MKRKMIVCLLLTMCFGLIGCEKEVNFDDVYKKLEGNTYNVKRCYQLDDYKYQMSFDLNFIEDKEVEFKFIDLDCISDKCYNDELDAYFIIYPVINSSTEVNKFAYTLEYDDKFKVDFENKNDGTYLNIDDIMFEYVSDRINNFGNSSSECIDVKTLISEEKPNTEEDVHDGYVETDNIHAKTCAIGAVKNKLARYSSIDVDVSSMMVNEAFGQFIIKGTVSYRNENNAKVNYSFTCQVKDLSSCDSSVIIY